MTDQPNQMPRDEFRPDPQAVAQALAVALDMPPAAALDLLPPEQVPAQNANWIDRVQERKAPLVDWAVRVQQQHEQYDPLDGPS